MGAKFGKAMICVDNCAKENGVVLDHTKPFGGIESAAQRNPAFEKCVKDSCKSHVDDSHAITHSVPHVVSHSAHHAGHVVSKKHDNETPKIVAGVVVGVLILVMIILLAKRK